MSFRIPSHWKEEYEENGGGTFYEDSPVSGTLRLNIQTFKGSTGNLQTCGYDELTRKPFSDGVEIIRLPSGDGMKKYRNQAMENGESLDLYYWEVAHITPPGKYYLAIFSWTILTEQSGVQRFRDEIEMITNELKQIRFHPELGSL